MSKHDVHVVAAVIDRGGRVLIGKRPLHKRYGGMWEFPGGKLEPGESYHQAIQRELLEELGVQVVASKPPHFTITEPNLSLVIYYIPTSVLGEEQAHEHEALAWVAVKDLLEYNLAPSDRAYAEFRMHHVDL